MIAIQKNDVCYSTANGGHNPFNTDGVERTTLDPQFARSALDFRILKRQSYDHEGRPIPSHFHLVKDTDNSFIPCAAIGSQFTPIQHIDIYDYIVNEIMPKVPEMELEMAGTIHGGGTGLVAAKFNGTFNVPGDKSESELRLFFSNPCNGTGRLVLGFTYVRVVCQNTLRAATMEAKQDGWRISHTKSSEKLAFDAVKSIRGQAVAALEMKERCLRLAEIGVDRATVERALDYVYPIAGVERDSLRYTHLVNLREKVVEEFEAGATAQTMERDSAWKLLNAFTYPVFHPEKIEKRMDRAEIAYKGMIGSVADKTDMMLRAVEMAVA